ncbi:MAG TPA: hypothetical protein VN131_07235 [Mobilitalea sp.]|nr:hypothetical protein [Mobilitalea sp.]
MIKVELKIRDIDYEEIMNYINHLAEEKQISAQVDDVKFEKI